MKKNKGDRIVQIILLLLIAAGIGIMVFLNMSESKASGNKSAYAGKPGTGKTMDSSKAPSSEKGGRPGGERPSAANAVAVEVYTVTKTDVNQYIKVNGDVSVETSIDIFSDTNGKLLSRSIKLGDSVRKGDGIARVDPSLPGQNYSPSSVRSTISGTVISLPMQVGDKVTTQTPIATIGNLDDLIIQTYIPEKFIAALQEGLTAEIRFDAFPGELFTAKISEINPVMDVNSRTLSVKLRFTRQDDRIRPGMFATMKLITRESRDTLAVPAAAILNYYGDATVYIISKQGLAERVIVQTGLSSDEEVEILSGLQEGDQVITQGQSKLTDGTAVRPVSKEASS